MNLVTKGKEKVIARGYLTVIVLILFAMALVGCGDKDKEQASNDARDNASEQVVTDGTSKETAADVPMRTISTVMGDVEIPENPQKIAGMLYVFADHLLALDIQPHAMVTYNDLGFPAYLADQMTQTIAIGSGEAPNLEALLEAEPDLILASKTLNEGHYEQLSRIAPTVLFDNENEEDWQRFIDTATVLGRAEAAVDIQEQYAAKVAQARDELARIAPGETVAYMRIQDRQLQLIRPTDNFTLFGALGLTPASVDRIDFNGGWNVAISAEVLPELNPNRMFIIVRPGEENQQALDAIMDTSIWKGLDAVQQDRVCVGDANLWFAGYGPIGLGKVIDEIVEAFAGEGETDK